MAEPSTGTLMFIAHRHGEMRLMAHLAERGYDDLTLAQARLAARIGDNGTRATELAEAAQVTKQTAGYLVDQLERAGYVERRPDPSDARARLVCFTDRGRALQREARTVERQVEREWSRHLGPDRLATLHALLVDLRVVTDPWREEPGS